MSLINDMCKHIWVAGMHKRNPVYVCFLCLSRIELKGLWRKEGNIWIPFQACVECEKKCTDCEHYAHVRAIR